MNKLVKNEKGYTLLEVVLSLSILSVVLLVFVGFFIQSKTFSVQTQSRMSADQLSQEILEKVKSSTFQADLTVDNWQTFYPVPSQGGIDSQGEFYIKVNKQNFYPVAKIKRANIQKPNFSEKLAYIQIEIYTKESGIKVKKFETYGFKGWL